MTSDWWKAIPYGVVRMENKLGVIQTVIFDQKNRTCRQLKVRFFDASFHQTERTVGINQVKQAYHVEKKEFIYALFEHNAGLAVRIAYENKLLDTFVFHHVKTGALPVIATSIANMESVPHVAHVTELILQIYKRTYLTQAKVSVEDCAELLKQLEYMENGIQGVVSKIKNMITAGRLFPVVRIPKFCTQLNTCRWDTRSDGFANLCEDTIRLLEQQKQSYLSDSRKK